MVLSKHKIFFITEEKEQIRFKETLEKYWRYYRQKTIAEASELSVSSYNYLICGLDLVGNELTAETHNIIYFDELLSVLTNKYYAPKASQRFKYQKGDKPQNKPRARVEPTDSPSTPRKDKDKINKIRKNLLEAYPFLDRKDLEESIDNYCRLIVKISTLMQGDTVINNVAIKNLTETMIKLGGFLGIDEGKKAAKKALEDKQSVASLSVTFQQTIDSYPEILDRLKYQELRILLEKYESNSVGISRELFESTAYAGMSIDKARVFISEREAKYEQKNS